MVPVDFVFLDLDFVGYELWG